MVILALIFFLILLIVSVTKKYWAPSVLILALYAFSLMCSCLLLNIDGLSYIKYKEPDLISTIVFCSFICALIFPFMKHPPVIQRIDSPLFIKRFCVVGYVVSILLVIGCILFLSKIQEAFAYGLLERREDMYKDIEVFTSYSFTEHIGNSVVRWLSGLDYAMMMMFFYALAFIPQKKYLKILLIVSSLSATYMGLMNGGRTHPIYWVMYFAFCLCVFWRYINSENKKLLLRVAGAFFVLISSYFVFMTLLRVEGSDRGTDSFLLTYMGQPFLNFGDFFTNCDWHPYTLKRLTPLTYSIFYGRLDLDAYRDVIFTHTGMNIGIFYTLLGDIFVDVGFVGLLIYVIAYNRFATKAMRYTYVTLPKLLIIGLYAQIVLHGLFYYSLYRMESTACVILLLFICKYLNVGCRT